MRRPTRHRSPVLEPRADAFRNYMAGDLEGTAEEWLVERAFMLTLTAPEMTALLGGMRVLGANAGGSQAGVFTERPGALTNDFFTNLLDMNTEWVASDDAEGTYVGRDRATGARQVVRHRRRPRFRFRLPAPRPSRRSTRATMRQEAFARDFAAAWGKVMNLDRYDLARTARAASA